MIFYKLPIGVYAGFLIFFICSIWDYLTKLLYLNVRSNPSFYVSRRFTMRIMKINGHRMVSTLFASKWIDLQALEALPFISNI